MINIEFLLLVVLLLVCFGVSVSLRLDNLLFKYKEKVNRIKRKSNLLKALLVDHDQLRKEQEKLAFQIRSFWDIEDLSRIYLHLNKKENTWLTATTQVVMDAEGCCSDYDKQSPRSIWGPLTSIIFGSMTPNSLQHNIDREEKKLTGHLERKHKEAYDIYKNIESSRSKTRSLLDQYTTEEEPSEVIQNQKPKKSCESLDELIKKNMDLFSGIQERRSIYLMLPLHAFLKDLSQLQLETETEKCWRTVAEEIIKDAEIHICNYLRWFEMFPVLKKLKVMSIPFVTHPFREKMKLIVAEFNKLLKYNLTFIDREFSKKTFIDRDSTVSSITKDTEITSAIKSKLKEIKKQEPSSKEVVDKMNSICVTLDKMYNQLQKAEGTEGIKACVEQLKSIVQELELDNFQELERHVTGPDTEFNNTIELLQQLTETCTIVGIEDSAKVVGLKIKERDLVLNLTASSASDNAFKLCIVGMKGVGKTTLAKAVCSNKVVVKHFPTRVWITVGAIKSREVLLMENNGTKNQTLTRKQVSGHLKDKLCLVVLDNVSQKNDFNNLYKLLSGSGWRKGSRIVVTTCFKTIALHVDSSSTPHHIRLLTKEESWALFQKVANIDPPEKKLELKLEAFAKKVVGKCGGLPLAILSLGFVMSAKDVTQDSLSWVFEQLNHGRYKTHWLQAWKNNRDEMSETLRNCLYYFTKFPLDYEISARRLVNLWVGEGLVQQNNQNTPEETAEIYLEELRDRSMIQVVALKPNGKIKTCCLPSMLREIILQNNSRTNHSRYFGMHLDQRFAYNFDDDGLDANSAQAFRKKGIPLSVLFFDKGEGSKPGERVGNILSTGIASEQFLKTRVLDLECIFRPQLPKNLSKLNNLKYLSLRWTYLEELPLCICKLLELETLDLKHTSINYIPSSIWELKKLKKLYLPQTHRSKLEGKLKGRVNETLQTLWGVFLYGNYPLLSHLHKLKSLQKLKLAFQLNGSEQESQNTLAQKIVNLEQLHSLSLKSVDEAGDPDKLISINMSKLEKLSSLRLYGKLEERLYMSLLPKNLTHLTLSASELSVDPMPELQNLLKLKSLCLYADSYAKERMVCASEGFQQLQVLRFWNLKKLKEWDVKEGAMPSLMEFEVRSCGDLAFPTGLKHLKTIRMIKLRKMRNKFVNDTRSLVNTKMSLVIVDSDED